jgi:hypothetical protein
MLQECLYSIQHIYKCNIVSNILHLFNLNIDTDSDFHIRDVGNPNALWTISTWEKVVADFNATWQPICTIEILNFPGWERNMSCLETL